jgi:hypothetical protein
MPKAIPWEQYRSVLYTRYITEDRSLSEVMEIMNQDYGFIARWVFDLRCSGVLSFD